MSASTAEAIAAFATPRDWLRHAVSRFRAADLVFGHGTASAVDEAAFIILEGLSLPIDDINPWLDARLLEGERRRLHELIEARVATRKPAAYLLNAAYIRGRRFHVDERVIVPRSYIGELILDGRLADARADDGPVHRILDLCTGSGCLAILAAEAFPEAVIDATDVSREALAVARLNIESHGLADRIRLLEGDLFAPVREERYDLILANPPYVAAGEMESFPPEHRAEPPLAHHGGPDGLTLVRRILLEAGRHLEEGGALVMEIGTGRAILEEELPDNGFLWLDTQTSEGEVLAAGVMDLANIVADSEQGP